MNRRELGGALAGAGMLGAGQAAAQPRRKNTLMHVGGDSSWRMTGGSFRRRSRGG